MGRAPASRPQGWVPNVALSVEVIVTVPARSGSFIHDTARGASLTSGSVARLQSIVSRVRERQIARVALPDTGIAAGTEVQVVRA